MTHPSSENICSSSHAKHLTSSKTTEIGRRYTESHRRICSVVDSGELDVGGLGRPGHGIDLADHGLEPRPHLFALRLDGGGREDEAGVPQPLPGGAPQLHGVRVADPRHALRPVARPARRPV